MRFLYVLVGFFLGIMFTTKVSERVIDAVDRQYADVIPALVLSGYHEGWQRGRDQQKAADLGYFLQAVSELQWHKEYIRMLRKQKGCTQSNDWEWKK